MATTQIAYTGDGSTVLYTFPFEYIDESEIIVEVDRTVTTAYSLANPTTIQFDTPPANGVLILITRNTDIDTTRVIYYPGSAIKAQDLNVNFDQSRLSVQEWRDQKIPYYNAVFPDRVDMDGNPIINVEDPTNAQDAATKNYVDTTTVASAGDTMTGDLNMGSNNITSLAEPSGAQDAATKNYVDTTTWNVTNETLQAGETWVGSDAYVATSQSIDQRIDSKIDTAITSDIGTDGTGITVTDDGDGTITLGLGAGSIDFDRIKDVDIVTEAEQDAGSPSPTDTNLFTGAASSKRFDTIVSNSTPVGSDWEIGKTWLQPVPDNTLSIWNGSNWIGVASGGTFLTQPTVIYVDSVNGNDSFDGHRIINPKKTIKNAVASASAGDIVLVAPGVYQETLPIDITVSNLSIVGNSQRSCFIHPTVATEEETMFRCNSGTYIDGFTFVGLKASGTRGNHSIDDDSTYGLPENQGWVAGFYPNCVIRKSPYINNCTNFADSGIDNSNFDPNNYSGTGGDITSGMTGGGIIVDGSVPDVSSPLRSFVVNEFTQINLDGPGLLVCNNGYAQAVSFFGTFCHYHAKALSGGQINMEVGTTDFGRYGLIADGKSSSAIFSATADGAALTGDTSFLINAPTPAAGWFGTTERPSNTMLVEVGGNIYPILSSSANGAGWNVVISNPDPSNRSNNLGLVNGHSSGASVNFYLRSQISAAAHTFEYAGSGVDYTALPQNGGVVDENNQVIQTGAASIAGGQAEGAVFYSSTDENGKFKLGDTFQVDQKTGFVTIDPQSYSTNLVSDLSPQLGGDLDVLDKKIYSSSGNVHINDTLEVDLGSASNPAITFNGDTNTGIYSPGEDQIAISTNGTQALYIDSDGDILVADGNRMEIDEIRARDGAGLKLYDDAGSGIFIQDDGNVGIGTTSPGVALHVDGDIRCDGVYGDTDTNTSIQFPGSDVITFNEGGSEAARIDNAGRLLIGTSTAVNTQWDPNLQVVSNNIPCAVVLARNDLTVTTNDTIGAIRIFGNDSNGTYEECARISAQGDGTHGTGDKPTRLVFYTTADGSASPTERMHIDSSGNVGIGATNPTVSLHVITSDNDKGLLIQRDSTNTNDYAQLGFAVTTSTAPSIDTWIRAVRSPTLGDNHITFGNNGSEKVRIDTSGRLLVGTSSARAVGSPTIPQNILCEHSSIAISAGFVRNTDDTAGATVVLGKSRGTSEGGTTIVQSGDLLGEIRFTGADGVDLETPAGSIRSEVDGTATTAAGSFVTGRRYKIATVGTTDFTLIGASENTVGVIFTATGAGTGTGTATSEPYSDSMPGRLVFSVTEDGNSLPTTSPSAMTINNAQEVLIGYSSDNGAYKLQVNSQIFATSPTIATSDGRYKENIATLDGCLDLVKALRPVSFTWKPQQTITQINDEGEETVVREPHNFPEGTQVGFIAQEVQEVLEGKPWLGSVIKENVRPAVKDNDGNELAPEEQFYGIAEGNLIAVLTNALQEATVKIEDLEARLTAAGL